MAELYATTMRPSKLELLEAWMGEQRWYAAKGRAPRLTKVFAWRLADPQGEVGIETLVVRDDSAVAGGGDAVTYQVPLTYRGAPVESLAHALVGTSEHGVLGTRWVYDATHDPLYATCLLELLQGRARAESSSESDALEEAVEGWQPASWRTPVTLRGASVLRGEQSNTSVVLDCTRDDTGEPVPLVVKVFRMLAHGDNPDVVLQGALRDAGCDRVPGVVGAVRAAWPVTTGSGEVGGTGGHTAYGHLAFAQQFLADVRDGWRLALEAAGDGSDFTAQARELGAATAQVHTTLASALPTVPSTPADQARLVDEMRERYAAATREVPSLAEHAERVEAVYAAAQEASWPALQRIHGDYHLGQVLHSPERGWVLLDFEGEPLRPLAERSEPDQWVRDVAGMLRSFDYAGGSVERERGGDARAWVLDCRRAFLDGYADAAGHDPREQGALLAAFELDKAMYEVVYEARNRPGWVDIPLGAVARLTADAAHTPAPETTTTGTTTGTTEEPT